MTNFKVESKSKGATLQNSVSISNAINTFVLKGKIKEGKFTH